MLYQFYKILFKIKYKLKLKNMNDPINEFGIFFVNFFLICLLFGIIYVPFQIFINIYLCNKCFITEGISKLLNFFGIQFPNYTHPLFLVFFIIYLILYGFYLIIIYVIPETGGKTLFIPIRELLLAIPPLPLLINKGVFKMFGNFFGFLSGFIHFDDFFKNYFEFSIENIIEYIRIFNPEIDTLIENMENYNKNNNQDNDKNDVDVCINSQAPITTPDMNFVNLFMNEIKNTKNSVRCNLNSIKTYIKTSANEASTEATDNINNINK